MRGTGESDKVEAFWGQAKRGKLDRKWGTQTAASRQVHWLLQHSAGITNVGALTLKSFLFCTVAMVSSDAQKCPETEKKLSRIWTANFWRARPRSREVWTCLYPALLRKLSHHSYEKKQNLLLPVGRISLEHIYMLASAKPSAYNKSLDMFFAVQFIALMHR